MLLETLRKKIPLVIVVSFVVGVVVGLVVLGWWLWPVQYTNTAPHSLGERYRETYVELVADSFSMTGDVAKAKERLYDLEKKGRSAQDVAAFVAEMARKQQTAGRSDVAMRLQNLASALGAEQVVTAPTTPEATVAPPGEEPEGKGMSIILRICLILLFALLIIVGLLLVWSYLRGRLGKPKIPRRVVPPRERPLSLDLDEAETEVAEEWPPAEIAWDASEEQLALGHFVTTFEMGDDGYDDSFGIETGTGEFLGECGVAISELITSGSPEKPTAFDIWLFDKSDIRTVTTVVVSPYAYEDETLRTKLGAKGDIILAQRGETLMLETASLRVRAEIVDLTYGGGELPAESYFTKFTVELAPSRKITE